jgi:hypothetical protein
MIGSGDLLVQRRKAPPDTWTGGAKRRSGNISLLNNRAQKQGKLAHAAGPLPIVARPGKRWWSWKLLLRPERPGIPGGTLI